MNLKVEDDKLLSSSIGLLKKIFEDETKIKILHDCRHDSLALSCLMGIKIANVFDTSGTDIYFFQRKIYEN